MAVFTKFQRIAIAVGAASGVAIYYLVSNPEKQSPLGHGRKRAYASWTTGYTPSTKWDHNWDHRDPKSLLHPKKLTAQKESYSSKQQLKEGSNELDEGFVEEQVKPKYSRNLILIRHGQYNLDGQTDAQRTLTALGMKQAEATGLRLKELNLPYTDMIKSTMSRAQQTGDLISKALPMVSVKNCDMLREGAPIPPEPPTSGWRPKQHFFKDGARIEAAFREYFHRAEPDQKEDTYTLLVCHANVIRYFVCRALQFPPEAWLRLSLNHASITWLTITPSGRVILRTLGDSGHMPPELLTSQ